MDFDELDDFELVKARDELKERLERARSGKGFATDSEKERQKEELLQKQAEEEAAELERLRLEDEAKLQSMQLPSYMSLLGHQHYPEADAETESRDEGEESEEGEGDESEDQESEEESDDVAPLPTAAAVSRGGFSSMLRQAQESATTSHPSGVASPLSAASQDTDMSDADFLKSLGLDSDVGTRSSRSGFSSMLEKASTREEHEVSPSHEQAAAGVPSLRTVLASVERDEEAAADTPETITASRQTFFSLGEQEIAGAVDELEPERQQEELSAAYDNWLNRERRRSDEDEYDVRSSVDKPTRMLAVSSAKRREREIRREEQKRRVNEILPSFIFGDHKARVRALEREVLGDGAPASAPIMPPAQAIGGGFGTLSGPAFGPGVTANVGDTAGLEAFAPLPRHLQARAKAKTAKSVPITLVSNAGEKTQAPSSQRPHRSMESKSASSSSTS